MSERTLRYKIDVKKEGKLIRLTISSTEEVRIDDIIAIAEHLQSKGDEESLDTH